VRQSIKSFVVGKISLVSETQGLFEVLLLIIKQFYIFFYKNRKF